MTTLTAAAALSLSGPLTFQGQEAARGLRSWVSGEVDDIGLQIADDGGSTRAAAEAYRTWLDHGVQILLGPYGSGMVRRVAPLASEHGSLLWNHGGAADDLARPLVVPVLAPASSYFHGLVELASKRGLRELLILRGEGRFASWVASGARQRAVEVGVSARELSITQGLRGQRLGDTAVAVVGRFADDVAAVAAIREGSEPGLLGCVGAGLPEFRKQLGSSAEGVVGPVQWIAKTREPEIGPRGSDFAIRYETEHGEMPSYVAAQAAAGGYLAAEAHRRGYSPAQVLKWKTSTLLGDFGLDQCWRQVGHVPVTIEWRNGQQIRAR